jgi:hypothetical protein
VLFANADPLATATANMDVPRGARLSLLRRGVEEPLHGGSPCSVVLPPRSAATLVIGR